jgi:hypothetical protein
MTDKALERPLVWAGEAIGAARSALARRFGRGTKKPS